MPNQSVSGPFSFFAKHYRGDYSLARSYWVNTVLITLFAPAAGLLLLPLLSDNAPARYASGLVLLLTAAGYSFWVWAIAGTWASANMHVSRGGKAGWATAAKVAIVLGVLRSLGEVGGNLPAYEEHARVALGRQPGEVTTFQVRADGKSLLLEGGINDGSADGLAGALKLAPQVRTIVLHSNGGWNRQGEMLAARISAGGLNTYVEHECTSACTIAFLAGKERSMDPSARLGFHTSRSVGGGTRDAELISTYRKAGLPERFIERVVETPHDKVWYPTREELLAAGVLTRDSQGGETAALATNLRSKEKLNMSFLDVPLFKALSEKYPADYAAIVDTAWEGVKARQEDHEIIASARIQILALTARLLPGASNEALLRLNKVMQEEAEALAAKHPKACIDLTFGTTGGPVNVSALLPSALVEREMAALTEVVRTSSKANMRAHSPEELGSVIQEALKELPQDQLAVIRSGSAREYPPRLACKAGISFYAAINGQPEPARSMALRGIYAAMK